MFLAVFLQKQQDSKSSELKSSHLQVDLRAILTFLSELLLSSHCSFCSSRWGEQQKSLGPSVRGEKRMSVNTGGADGSLRGSSALPASLLSSWTKKNMSLCISTVSLQTTHTDRNLQLEELCPWSHTSGVCESQPSWTLPSVLTLWPELQGGPALPPPWAHRHPPLSCCG